MGQTRIGKEPAEAHLAVARQHGLPDKDIPILAAAVAQGAHLLVTGDRRDFGHLYGSCPGEIQVIDLPGAIERVLAASDLSPAPFVDRSAVGARRLHRSA